MEQQKLCLIDQLALLRITHSSDIPPHEFLFRWNDIPCFARGELVAVTGKAKSGKTYLNSILMASAGVNIAHSSQYHFLGLNRIQEQPLRVMWIDTEQSEDTTCEILRDRISVMMDEPADDDHFHVFNLRQTKWQDRILLVLTGIAFCQPDLVVFDGIRDAVGDINDYTAAQQTIGQLLAVASSYRTCIVCVLHQNKAVEDKTLRGALGTELQNKSFETYECSKDIDTRIFSIRQTATRKYDIPSKIQFCVSPQGLPVPCHTPEDPSSSVQSMNSEKTPFNPNFLTPEGKIDKIRLFSYLLPPGKRMGTEQLRAAVMRVANVHSFNFAMCLIQEAQHQNLLCKDSIRTENQYEYIGP